MSAPINRTLISRGPAVILFRGAKFFSRDSIILDWGTTEVAPESDAYGPIFSARNKVAPTLVIPLVGSIENLDILYPSQTMLKGQSIFGSSDTPLVIMPMDASQEQTTFYCAGVIEEPDLALGVTASNKGIALDKTKFAIIPSLGASLTQTNAFFSRQTNTWDGTGFNPDDILVQSYDVKWLSQGAFTLNDGAENSAAIPFSASQLLASQTATLSISDGSEATAALSFQTTAAQWQTALNALAAITTDGGVTVTGSLENGLVVTTVEPDKTLTLTGTLAGATGASLTATVTQAATVSLPEIVTLTFNYNLATAVAAALNACAAITTLGGVTVTGDGMHGLTVTTVSNNKTLNLSGAVSGMPGGTSVLVTQAQAPTASLPNIVVLQLSPWAWLPTKDAIKIKTNAKFELQTADAQGVYDYLFEPGAPTAEFTPLNVNDDTISAAMQIQGANAALGMNLTSQAHNLDISGQGLYIRLYAAKLTKAPLQWSAMKERVGACQWTAQRSVGQNGVLAPFFYIGTAAPTN